MYHVALEGVSRYALNEAVKSIIRGALGHTFFPSPVEFRQQCEKAIEPHIRQAERIKRREQQESENIQFERVIASRTPEAIARQQAAYQRYCEQYKASKPVSAEATPILDADLVAKVPDAPATFKRANVA